MENILQAFKLSPKIIANLGTASNLPATSTHQSHSNNSSNLLNNLSRQPKGFSSNCSNLLHLFIKSPKIERYDSEKAKTAQSLSISPEPQLGAVCKSVVIANLLNYLLAQNGYHKKIHALKPEILAIFNADKARHQNALSINLKTLLNLTKKENKTVPDILKGHSVQGEILSKTMALFAIKEVIKQQFNQNLANKIDAQFLNFNSLADFKHLIQESLKKNKGVAVFFNMNFPLKLADSGLIQSVNPNPCAEFYEHVAMVRSIFQEEGIDKVIINHFGRDFVERLDALYQSNQNLKPRQIEAYIQNADYFNPKIKTLLKKQYQVKSTQQLNIKLKEVINSADIYDFESKEHYLAYIYTREYFSKEHYETHFKPWLNLNAEKNPEAKEIAFTTFNSCHQPVIVKTTNMLINHELKEDINSQQPDNCFKSSLLVCALNH